LEHGEEPTSLEDTLPDAQFLSLRKVDDHFAERVQFLTTVLAPSDYKIIQKK
jgi:transposase InsO family protein